MHIPRGGLEDEIYIEYPIQGEMEGEKIKRNCSMGYYAPINNIYSNNDNLVKVSISLHNKEIVQESDINLVLDTGQDLIVVFEHGSFTHTSSLDNTIDV